MHASCGEQNSANPAALWQRHSQLTLSAVVSHGCQVGRDIAEQRGDALLRLCCRQRVREIANGVTVCGGVTATVRNSAATTASAGSTGVVVMT